MILCADPAMPQYETGARSPTALTHCRAPGSEPGRAGSPGTAYRRLQQQRRAGEHVLEKIIP
jgi:hypothetical protein